MNIPDLIVQLTSPDRNFRLHAADSLGQSADVRAAEALCDTLADSDRGVRSAAALALARVLCALLEPTLMLTDGAVKRLCDALSNKDNERYVRCVAAQALGRCNDSQAIPALCAALGDIDMRVYSTAADSIVQTGDCCILPLCDALYSANEAVRFRADATLTRIRTSSPRLAYRILCSKTLTTEQIVDTFEALHQAPQQALHMFTISLLPDVPSNLETFCKNLFKKKGVDSRLKRGAEAVLAELERRSNPAMLLRASKRDNSGDKVELLRAYCETSRTEESDELVRPAEGGMPRQ